MRIDPSAFDVVSATGRLANMGGSFDSDRALELDSVADAVESAPPAPAIGAAAPAATSSSGSTNKTPPCIDQRRGFGARAGAGAGTGAVVGATSGARPSLSGTPTRGGNDDGTPETFRGISEDSSDEAAAPDDADALIATAAAVAADTPSTAASVVATVSTNADGENGCSIVCAAIREATSTAERDGLAIADAESLICSSDGMSTTAAWSATIGSLKFDSTGGT